MIDLPILWLFLVILATHYVADFMLQTHWQASNKSKNNRALLDHVGVYTVVMGMVTGVLFNFSGLWFSFIWINAVLHFCTDYVTSRWSSIHAQRAIRDTCWVARFMETCRCEPSAVALERGHINPGRHWHNFFVVIGLDQLIHQTTLAVTLWLIVE